MSTNIVAGSTPTDFETAAAHTITVRETLAGASNSPRDTVLTINVTDVSEGGPTPLTIFGANLVAWYDPQDQATVFSDAGTTQITNGGTVVQVNDKSGNNRHLTAITTTVTWHSGGMSSKSALKITLDSGTGGLRTGLTAVALGVSQSAAWAVAQTDIAAMPSSARLVGFLGSGDGGDTSANSVIFLFATSGSLLAGYQSGQLGDVATGGDLATKRFSSVFDGVNHTPYTNNSAGSSAACSATVAATGRLLVGCNATGGNAWTTNNAAIGEIVIVKGAVTSQQRTDMDTYLSGRW